MPLLNLNALLAENGVSAEPFMRAKIRIPGKDNFTHVFSDTHLTLTRANPVEADESGIFALCYLMDGEYDIDLHSESDVFRTRLASRLIAAPHGNGYLQRFASLSGLAEDASLSYDAGTGQVQVAPGDYVKVNDSGHTYRVAPADATTAPIASQGGVRFYVNQNRYDLKAEALGVKMTGADADAARNAQVLQAAIDWLCAEGGGRVTLASEGHMKIDRAIALRPGVTVDGAGSVTDNILTRQGHPADSWGEDATYITGGFAKTDHDDHTWHALEQIEKGTDHVIFQTEAHADAYEVGDIVWVVEAVGAWGDGQVAQPAQSEIARIARKTGNVLSLEFHNTLDADVPAGAGTIGVSATGAWIANVDWRVSAGKDHGNWTDTRFILKDATLVNHRLMQSGQDGEINTALFGTRSGVYNCHIENIEGLGMVANLLYGNGYVNSRYHNISGPYFRRAIELKYLSRNSTFSDLDFWKVNHDFIAANPQYLANLEDVEEDPPVTIGEDARGVKIDGLRLNVGKWLGLGAGINLINFVNATDCQLRNIDIRGEASFGTAIAFPNAKRCEIIGGTIGVPTSVTIEDNGIDCAVRDVTFPSPVSTLIYRRGAEARGGRITGNTWHHEAPARILAASGTEDRAVLLASNHGLDLIENPDNRLALLADNLSGSWEKILSSGANAIDLVGGGTSNTSPAVLGQSVTVPAGALRPGDILEWIASGECVGGFGARSLSWRASVDLGGDGIALDAADDINTAGTVELPASCNDWVLRAKAIVTSLTRIVTQFEVVDLTSGNSLGAVTWHLGADLDTSDTIFTLSGWVANGSDALILRTVERSARRHGFLGPLSSGV